MPVTSPSRPTPRSSRWLVLGILLTAVGLVLTHVPGAVRSAESARARP